MDIYLFNRHYILILCKKAVNLHFVMIHVLLDWQCGSCFAAHNAEKFGQLAELYVSFMNFILQQYFVRLTSRMFSGCF